MVMEAEKAHGVHTGFYSVRFCLPGHTLERPLLGAPLFVRGERLWPFDPSQTSPAAELAAQLPEGWGVVEQIVDGPSLDTDPATAGRFLVQWFGNDSLEWVHASQLRGNALFKAYSVEKGLSPLGHPKGTVLAQILSDPVRPVAPVAPLPPVLSPEERLTELQGARGQPFPTLVPGQPVFARQVASMTSWPAVVVQDLGPEVVIQWNNESRKPQAAVTVPRELVEVVDGSRRRQPRK